MGKNFWDTIKWYDQNAHEYAKASFPNFYAKEIEDFAALLPNGARVLDAGCGGGRDCKRLMDKGFKATGLDISKGLIEYCREHFPYINFVEGDIRQVPFSDASFEGIWAHVSLVHLETVAEVKKSLQEFFRLLVSGGVIHIMVRAQKGEKKREIVTDRVSKHERFYLYFKKEELEEYLKEAGFEIISTEQFREIERMLQGRPEVELMVILARK